MWLLVRDAESLDVGNEWIVGGSCFGSPARMSFVALNIGIQQTYNERKKHDSAVIMVRLTASSA